MSTNDEAPLKRLVFEVDGPARIQVIGDADVKFAALHGTLTVRDWQGKVETTTSTSFTNLATKRFGELIAEIQHSDLPESRKKELKQYLEFPSADNILKALKAAQGSHWLLQRLAEIYSQLIDFLS